MSSIKQRILKKNPKPSVRPVAVTSKNEDDKSNGKSATGHQESISKSLPARCVNVSKYVILFLIIPPLLNYASLHQESSKLQPPGALYDIGFGQKLFLGCAGNGFPTVVLDAPTGMNSDVWVLVVQELAKITKVCVYDRVGLGFSERPYQNTSGAENIAPEGNPLKQTRWQPFTVERMADDLYHLLSHSSHQEKPFIMVGSEMGAMVARFYAQLYEGDVSDLVLVDPLVESLITDTSSGVWTQFWFGHLVPSFQSMQLSAAVGLTRLALIVGFITQPLTGANIPDDVITRQKYLLCHPRHLSTVVDEHFFINETFSQMKTVLKIKPFPSNVSVTVINGNYYDDQLPSSLNKAWAKSQQHLISQLHPGSKHILVNGADHRMLYRQPEAIVEPVKKLVKLRRKYVKSS